jgi:hypothetical protein
MCLIVTRIDTPAASLYATPMRWPTPAYADRTVYNKAGKSIVNGEGPLREFEEALEIIGNWRASHQYPLHAIAMGLRVRARRFDKDALIVQRSKRLASILPKLLRMRLTQIQDIGGCRAVMNNLSRLEAVHKAYMKLAAKTDKRRPYLDGDPDDYIASPKRDGYRGIHYVYRYRSEQKEFECFNEMKIEIQLRTRAQHSWATALEIVDMFTGQKLKSDIEANQADPDWKRFFALTSSVIAVKEGCPPVPETPAEYPALLLELAQVTQRLDAVTKLEDYGRAVFHMGQAPIRKGGEYLVTLNSVDRVLQIKLYEGKTVRQIDDDYLAKERAFLNRPNMQVLQVKAKSLEDFRRGYPNYALDTSAFVKTLKDALASD